VTVAEFSDTSGDPAAGGLSSTAEDLVRWMQALQAGRIVRPATLELATTPVTLAGGRQGSYGFGFMLRPFRGLREIAHGGDISGFNSYVGLYPTERLSVIVLSNVGMRPPGPLPTAGDIAHGIVSAELGQRLGPEHPDVAAVSAAVLQGYVGRYRLLAPPPVQQVMGEVIEIRQDGGRMLASGKQGEAEILPESETRFFSRSSPVQITFTPAREGAPVRAFLSLMGLREFSLERVQETSGKGGVETSAR
jgi:hypothetical protein